MIGNQIVIDPSNGALYDFFRYQRAMWLCVARPEGARSRMVCSSQQLFGPGLRLLLIHSRPGERGHQFRDVSR